MEDTTEERQQQAIEVVESSPVVPLPVSTDETIQTEQPSAAASLLQSLLQEQPDETGDKKKKKKKKAKTGRQKELVNIINFDQKKELIDIFYVGSFN